MDLIDRQKTLLALRNSMILPVLKHNYRREDFEKLRLLNVIEQMPAVEPKRGEWKEEREVERGTTTFTLVKCSYCGQWALKKIYNAIQNLGEAQLRYCPNCGADMRGKGNKGTNSHEIQKTTTERN
ncbi:MAG: hypothetical protein MJY89_07715 [Bacteroidales bacterium]|nr:hypothetical protein [Bacteroidales bacterium]